MPRTVRPSLRTLKPWGMVDQGLSSVSYLGLSVVAARALGSRGLGILAVGFSAYLFTLAAQRAFVTDPLTVHIAALPAGGVRSALGRGFATALAGGVLLTVTVALIGWGTGGAFGRGILVFAPWLLPALLQDFCRAALFRADRGAAAACNDGVWVGVMAFVLVLGWGSSSEWTIVTAWGAGAGAGAILGLFQLSMGVPRCSGTRAWWWREIVPLGRWLALESMCIASVGVLVPVIVVSSLGAAAVGGLRAVDAIFAPMTLVGQGLELPWLPELARSWTKSHYRARRQAATVSGIAVVLIVPYLMVVVVFRSDLLAAVFGPAFRSFSDLVAPGAVTQLIFASAIGFFVLLKASRRGRARFAARAVASVVIVSLVAILATTGSLVWVAWGRAIGIGCGEVLAAYLVLGRYRDGGIRSPARLTLGALSRQ